MNELSKSDPYIERRQIGIIDIDGRTAARSGELNGAWAGHREGDNYIALGNGLVGINVIDAMAETFESNADEDLEQRLMLSLESGLDAGGEIEDMTPYHSAAILVYGHDTFARVDLRVDEHSTAVKELRRILDLYRRRLDYFLMRPKDPDAAVELKDLT